MKLINIPVVKHNLLLFENNKIIFTHIIITAVANCEKKILIASTKEESLIIPEQVLKTQKKDKLVNPKINKTKYSLYRVKFNFKPNSK